MESKSFVSILIQMVSRLRATTFTAVILASMLLASGRGSVWAASEKSADVPNCGGQPICGYIQAHAVESTAAAKPECGAQPICGYLEAHNADGAGIANTSLPAFLAAQPRPSADDMQLAALRPTLVRSGPGAEFFSYGELPTAAISRVMGVNQLGNWWVIPMPFTTAPDGLGWVDAAAVKVSNLAMTRVDLPACEGLAYCGYLQAHSQPAVVSGTINCSGQSICGYLQAHNTQDLAVFAPTFATEMLFGQPGIAVTGLCRPATITC